MGLANSGVRWLKCLPLISEVAKGVGELGDFFVLFVCFVFWDASYRSCLD